MFSLSGEDAPAPGHQRLAEAINQLPGLYATARPGLDWQEIGVAHETVVFGITSELDWWDALERLAWRCTNQITVDAPPLRLEEPEQRRQL